MARWIDIDPIVEKIKYSLSLGGRGEYNEGYDAALNTVLDYINDELALTPQHEALTLDELREMKDEPAYLKVFDPLLESGWHIVKAVTEDKIIFRGWGKVYVPIDVLGETYNLYRRPPEGEEDNQ